MKRPFRTEYYDTLDASGKLPVRVGHCATLSNARRNVAVHLVMGNYKLGSVIHEEQLVTFLRVTDLQFQDPVKELS